MPSFEKPEPRQASAEFYRCRKCGKLLSKAEVYDIDGMHFCFTCSLNRGRKKTST